MNNHLENELAIASEMQRKLMPSADHIKHVKKKHGLSIAHAFEPSHTLSGDFWGCQSMSDEECAFYLCDFAGHGLSAAINTFRFHALLDQQLEQWGRDAAYFINLLNRQMAQLLPPNQFATLFYGIFHSGLDSIFYIGAGSPQPLLIHTDGSTEWIDSRGLPIGINNEWSYNVAEIPFCTGDMLILYSDSLIEYGEADACEKNMQRFADTARQSFLQNKHQSDICTDTVLQDILKQNQSSRGKHVPLPDDLTVTIYYRPPEE